MASEGVGTILRMGVSKKRGGRTAFSYDLVVVVEELAGQRVLSPVHRHPRDLTKGGDICPGQPDTTTMFCAPAPGNRPMTNRNNTVS